LRRSLGDKAVRGAHRSGYMPDCGCTIHREEGRVDPGLGSEASNTLGKNWDCFLYKYNSLGLGLETPAFYCTERN